MKNLKKNIDFFLKLYIIFNAKYLFLPFLHSIVFAV